MRQLSEVLPSFVLKKLADQFRDGINSAVMHYPELRGDEDTVTGGLIHAIGQVAKGNDRSTGYSWSAKTWKLRGRGRGAPEKKIGADAVLEVEVKDAAGGVVTRKSLPIQSKKEWVARDPLLQNQSSKLATIPGGGIVIDYTECGYFAASAEVAARAEGDRRRMPADGVRPLGDVLADQFLPCHIGSTNIYFDATNEMLLVAEDGTLRGIPFSAKHRIRVDLKPGPQRVGWPGLRR